MARMASRGPDGEGLWHSLDRKITFGHRRLSIIDLSDRANQPMVDETGDHVITFNGEIYNYQQLREELQCRGIRLRTT